MQQQSPGALEPIERSETIPEEEEEEEEEEEVSA
eukprot:COSAG01_NODE_52103_length_349_cov_0.788000_1_plen_33_part_10